MRNICILILIAICGIHSNPLVAQSSEEPLFTGAIGIAPYTFRNSFPNGIAETLDTIKLMGFTEIEGGGGNIPAADYKQLCAERGLSIPSMGASYQQLTEAPEEIIKRAKVYGSKYVMVAWIPHTVGSFNIEDTQVAVKDFNRVGKLLANHGITLCYHAHGYELQKYQSGTLLDYLVEHTNPDYVSFEMDIFWIQFGGGDPVALLDKYGTRWKLMHLKDMKRDIKKDHTGLTDPQHDVALGKGQIDIREVVKAAQRAGIKHYFIEDESNRILQQLPQSITYLRALRK